MKFYNGWALPDYERHFNKYGYLSKWPVTNYQDPVLREALTLCPQKNVAVDVGANIGLHSVRLAEQFQEVHAFEPVVTCFECLQENTSPMGNVTYYYGGLSNKEEEVTLAIAHEVEGSGCWSIENFKEYDDSEIRQETNTLKPLDSYELEVDFIKIDVEAYEVPVLEGAEETFRNHSPIVLIEMHNNTEEITSVLQSFGYNLYNRINKDGIWTK